MSEQMKMPYCWRCNDEGEIRNIPSDGSQIEIEPCRCAIWRGYIAQQEATIANLRQQLSDTAAELTDFKLGVTILGEALRDNCALREAERGES